MWAQADIELLLNYVEDNQSKAGDRMALQEGHFNGLFPLLPCQANGHPSTIAGGLGLAYSADKGANIVTEVGQLVMDELVKLPSSDEEKRSTHSLHQTKGFKYLERMQKFVPPDKVKGTNAHHTAGTQLFTQIPQVTMPSSAGLAASFTQPALLPHLAATQLGIQLHPAVVQPQLAMQLHPAVAHQAMQFYPAQYQLLPVQPYAQSSTQLTFVQCQPGPLDQSETMQIAQDTQPAHKTNATAGLDTASTVASSALGNGGTGSSQKRCTQVPPLENTVQNFVANMNDSTNKALTMIGTDKVEQLHEVLSLVYDLEKNLSEKNLVCLQMLLEEKPSFIVGYQNTTAKSTTYRMWWVK
ncbi:hypothetical protein F5141DRAFT_1071047 [Pisolithus sp. B1]|nr:hypothetical protein F5141DRAFT_1071047 [Pisolithus sp. B1]